MSRLGRGRAAVVPAVAGRLVDQDGVAADADPVCVATDRLDRQAARHRALPVIPSPGRRRVPTQGRCT